MTLDQPWLLILLALVPLSAWMTLRSRARLSLRRNALATGFRSLALIALVLAVAGFGARGRGPHTTVFAIDSSESVLLSEQANALDLVEAYVRATGAAVPVGVVQFAARAGVIAPPGRLDEIPALGGDIPRGATDVAAGLASALSLIPIGDGGQVVLVSDGNATRGDEQAAVQAAVARGISVSVAPVRSLPGTDLTIASMRVPTAVRQGAPAQARIVVSSDRLTTARLRVWDGERLLSDGPVQLRAGSHEYAVDVSDLPPGFHRLRAELLEDADLRLANNVAEAYLQVTPVGAVLSVTRDGVPSPLAGALVAGGLRVTDIPLAAFASTDLEPFDAVFMSDLPADALGEALMVRLRDWVRAGGGLVVSGGRSSFAAGEYQRTPLDDTLPVWSNPTEERPEPRLALVLVIDKSSSMAGGSGEGNAKIDLAIEAAVEAVALLSEGDILGVLTFDNDSQWVVPPRPIQSADDLQRVIDRIRGISIGSSTDLFRAMFSVRARLRQVEASIKHIVLLTDGRARYGDFDVLTRSMRRSNMTISTIALGADADRELLDRIARLGNGRAYFAADPSAIPQVLTEETRMAGEFAIVEREFQPRLANPSPIFAGELDGLELPSLRGFVRTRAKPTAEVVLASDSNDPVLAQWQFGRGRAVAWTSDAGESWAADWSAWPNFEAFVSQVADWVMPPAGAPKNGLFVSTRVTDGRGIVTVDATTADGGFLNNAAASVVMLAPDGSSREIPLDQIAPGRYQATTPTLPPAVYELRIALREPAGEIVRTGTGLVVPAAAEVRRNAPDLPLLRRIADTTGGRVIESPSDLVALAVQQGSGVAVGWPLLVTLGLLFFVLDVGSRRLRGSPREVVAQLREQRARLAAVLGRRPRLTLTRPRL